MCTFSSHPQDVARNQKYIGFDDDKLRLHPGHATEHAMYGHAYSHSFGDNAVLPVQEGEVDEADMVPLEDFFPAHIREEFDNENLAYESELAKRGPLKSKK